MLEKFKVTIRDFKSKGDKVKARILEKFKILSPRLEKKHRESGDMKIPRDTAKKILRGGLWGTLAGLCVLGIWSVIKPDPAITAKRLINNWKEEQSQAIKEEELMSFTNDFLKAYYTVEIDGKDRYLSALKKYASKEVLESPAFDFKSHSNVNYANAYRIEDIGGAQVNVYATVSRTVTAIKSEEAGMTSTQREGTYTVKVPVYIGRGHYVVEGIPMIVADTGYKAVPSEYEEKKIAKSEMSDTADIKAQVNNFLRAYYSNDQNLINQYLPEGMDTMNFKAVSVEGSYTFDGVESLKAYKNDDDSIMCLVSFQLLDNQTKTSLRQQFHLVLVQKDAKVYIKQMDTKTINLK